MDKMDKYEATASRFKELKPGWDSYGGKPISHKCLDKALSILSELSDEYQMVPDPDGGVQLERHTGGLDIEIYIVEA